MAKYVRWLEAAGFIFVGIILAAMVGSLLYKIDDVVKFTGVEARAWREPVKISIKSYVHTVLASECSQVEQGEDLLRIIGSPEEEKLITSIDAMHEALRALEKNQAGDELIKPLQEALSRAISNLKELPVRTISAPITGTVNSSGAYQWDSLAGKVVIGEVGIVTTYDSLRFTVPLAGENASRVRINLLAEEDVKDWKQLTSQIKSLQPPVDPVRRLLWDRLQNKLIEVKPGKRPLKRSMPEIVASLNEILRQRDLYDPQIWGDKEIPPEAQELINTGIPNLKEDELIRLNRLLLEAALSGSIQPSINERQVVKAKIYIPVTERLPGGTIEKKKPIVVRIQGGVVYEHAGGAVMIELPNPPDNVVDYIKSRAENPELPPVTVSGNIVVGRISLFNFLFK